MQKNISPLNSIQKLGPILILVTLLVIAIFLRVFRLDSLPAEMHRDEVGIGYNALSLVTNLKDEHGVGPWPISFISFGDYKLPNMIYLVAGSVKLWGLSTWSIRLPNALIASTLVIIIYYFALQLFKNKRTALLTSGLLTFSVWHTFLARTVYEPIAGLTLNILALTLLLKARKNIWFIFGAVIFWGISFFTYNLPFLLAPFLFFACLFIFWQDFINQNKKILLSGIASFLLVLASTFFIFQSVNTNKSGTTILHNQNIIDQITDNRNFLFSEQVPHKLRILITAHPLVIAKTLTKNYFSAFNPNYLFFQGGGNEWHSLQAIGIGNINPVNLILFLFGWWAILQNYQKNKKLNKSHLFLIFYFLISPLPDALTIDAPVTNRLLSFHLSIILFAALGANYLIQNFSKQNIYKIITLILGILFFGYWAHFTLSYHFLHPKNMTQTWAPYSQELTNYINQNYDQYDRIFINHQTKPFYPYLAFWTQYDPIDFQINAIRETSSYNDVAQFGKFILNAQPLPPLIEINPTTLEYLFPQNVQKILYIYQTPHQPIFTNPELQPIHQITNYKNQIMWEFYELSPDQFLNIYLQNPTLKNSSLNINYLQNSLLE